MNGKPYAQSAAPITEAGILLEARAIHPGLSAYQYLLARGATHGIGSRRVLEVLGPGGAARGREAVAGGHRAARVALGALLRSTADAISALVGLVMLVPILGFAVMCAWAVAGAGTEAWPRLA